LVLSEYLFDGVFLQHMSAGKHAFKKCEVKRLVEAVIAGGLPPDRLRIAYDLKNSKILVEVVPGSEITSEKPPNPWDELL
jgi:hypothetical protein